MILPALALMIAATPDLLDRNVAKPPVAKVAPKSTRERAFDYAFLLAQFGITHKEPIQ